MINDKTGTCEIIYRSFYSHNVLILVYRYYIQINVL